MRFYESQILERVGFDFYCDIACNIVKARKEKQLTQEELAAKAKIRLSRLSGIENVRTRIDVDDLEKLSQVLDVSIDWLIDADLDSQYGECLYLIWPESMPDFKLYKKATSKSTGVSSRKQLPAPWMPCWPGAREISSREVSPTEF